MYQQHYDVIIFGESLASRITAALLAKVGNRVLTFQEENSPLPSWLTASLHMEKFLETLDGRSCYTAPATFQVLTGDVRIDINGKMPLEDELRRELTDCREPVLALLNTLKSGGQRLEELILKKPAPLFSRSSRTLFIVKQGVGRLGLGPLNRNVQEWIEARVTNPKGLTFLKTLFSGISLTPTTSLSVAEAALLWHSLTRPSGISPSGLEDLLRHRYEQFHGEYDEINTIKDIVFGKKRIDGVVLKNGSSCTADTFLLASDHTLQQLPDGWTGKSEAGVQRLFSPPLGEKVSPLLAKRILVDATPPLRLTLGKRDGETYCAVDLPPGLIEDEHLPHFLSEHLRPVFPFVDLTFSQEPDRTLPHVQARGTGLLGQSGPLLLGRNTVLCSGSAALPSLGSCGEAILGTALANRLSAKTKK